MPRGDRPNLHSYFPPKKVQELNVAKKHTVDDFICFSGFPQKSYPTWKSERNKLWEVGLGKVHSEYFLKVSKVSIFTFQHAEVLPSPRREVRETPNFCWSCLFVRHWCYLQWSRFRWRWTLNAGTDGLAKWWICRSFLSPFLVDLCQGFLLETSMTLTKWCTCMHQWN